MRKDKYNLRMVIPLIITLAIVPLIAYYKDVPYPLTGYYWTPDETSKGDFFSYYKSIFITITGVLCVIALLYSLTKKKISFKDNLLLLPLLGYVLMLIVSWVLSPYKFTSTIGYMDRYEGGLVLLSYVFICIYAYKFINNKQQLEYIYKAFFITVVILNTIGLTQLLGIDFLQTGIGRALMLPPKYWSYKDSVQFTFQNNEVYQTLYNINYVGSFLAFVFPLIIILSYYTKNIKFKVLLISLYLLVLLNLFGSKSAGGIIGFIIILVLVLMVLNKKLLAQWKISLAYFILTGLCVLAFSDLLGNELINPIKETQASVSTNVNDASLNLNDIYVTDGIITMIYDGLLINFEIINTTDSQIEIISYLEDDTNIVLSPYDEGYIVSDERFKEITFDFAKLDDDNYGIQFIIGETKWLFSMDEIGFTFINGFNKTIELRSAPYLGFEGNEKWGNSRGYIWSRSLPIIKDHIFIGSGPDTYIYEFPHYDYLAKNKAGFERYHVIDKPHNMYLGIAINTGLLSLILLLIFWIWYSLNSIKTYFISSKSNYFNILHVSIFIGFCGFMIIGLVNDSNVSTSPLLWAFTGIDLAVMQLLNTTTN